MGNIKKENTICLIMIVKNESKVIERCLSSVKDIIDYWVISDTGSTDGTQKIIVDFFEKNNIKGELHENPWRDFAYNRSIACKLAKNKAEYIITLDADEVFKYDENFYIPSLTCDAYYIMTRNNAVEYTRMQLVSDRFEWYYKDILHEYIHTDTPIQTVGLLAGIYNHPSPDGARSADPNKYRKDALVLERGLLDEPDNIRYRFYLAQSYRDCNDYENAIKNYILRAEAFGFDEEKYYAMYEVGMCKMRRGDKFESFAGDFLKAYNFRPSRLEAAHKLIRYCRINNMAFLAYQLFKHIFEKKSLSVNDILFVEKPIYEYQIYDELSIAAYWSENYGDSIIIINRILQEKKYPQNEHARILKNLELSKEGLQNMANRKKIEENKIKVDWNKINRENIEEVFNAIYDSNEWGYKEQRLLLSSGFGNTLNETKEYRNHLKRYIKNNGIKSVLDVGCGIWEFEHDEFDNITYIGIDCVKKVIEYNKDKYSEKNRLFICADILSEKNNIPFIDLCIIKDVLQHLSNENLNKLIQKILPKVKYILLVNDREQMNDGGDIQNGEYRRLNLKKSPLKEYEPFLLNSYSMKDICLIGKDSGNFMHNNRKVSEIIHKMMEEKRIDEEEMEKRIKTMGLQKNIEMKIDMGEETVGAGEATIVGAGEGTGISEGTVEAGTGGEGEDIASKYGKVLFAILARNKEHVLREYLKCVDELIYDKKLIHIYINTNDNIDNTVEILDKWVEDNVDKYASIEIEKGNYVELESTSVDPHIWTNVRFKRLARIRNKSLQKTIDKNCDFYFVCDCDNFIIPTTLRDLVRENKPIIAPMLKGIPEVADMYSNYFAEITPSGYMKNCPEYYQILERKKIGVFKMPVVHCTYLIKSEFVDKLNYIDDTEQHEFVIFSRCARNNGIDQYISNKEEYGKCVHFYDDKITLENEQIKMKAYFEKK